MSRQHPALFAAIHVGSEHISMQIVEYKTIDDMRIVERVSTQVSLGEETFKTGRISFGAVNELCGLLKGYRRMCTEYGVKDYQLLATTAIREAVNQQYIIDQIQIKTGFSVQVVDMPHEIFYKYAALFKAVETAGMTRGQEGLLFVDISSGGLGITLYKAGVIEYQQNIHIGALRIKESFEKYQRESAYFGQALNEYIFSVIEPVQEELKDHAIKYLVLSGSETRMLLGMLGRSNEETMPHVSVAEFYQLYEEVKTLNLPQLIKQYNLTETMAEVALPTIVLYKQFLDIIKVEELVVPQVRFIDGMSLLYIGDKTKSPWLAGLDEQTVSLARSLGKKYCYDPKHSGSVEKHSLELFDCLARVHGLGGRERLMIQVAAILHDVGKHISLRKHYYYSTRLIEASDIPGFSEGEKSIIAAVAYYHSKGTPNNFDGTFAKMDNKTKMTVAKLAAIIRLADAIDRTHLQKAITCDFALKGEELIVRISTKEDYSLEEWTFIDKAVFFEEVFGIRAVLIRQAG